jgi:hypothetical protein
LVLFVDARERLASTMYDLRLFEVRAGSLMAQFNILINLGKADLDDYSLLGKTLRKLGFSETRAAQVGGDFRLLPASYRYSSDVEDMTAVRDKALRSAKSVSAKAVVLVSEI